MELVVPEGYQLILGQSHFIKTVEDIYEALVTAVPGIRFGIAFCESSGKALVRHDGTDEGSLKMAIEFAEKLSCGHAFVIILRDAYPINVMKRVKDVDEVVGIYCATANKVTAIVASAGGGRGILGVIDGVRTGGVETDLDKSDRREFLRKIGYKR